MPKIVAALSFSFIADLLVALNTSIDLADRKAPNHPFKILIFRVLGRATRAPKPHLRSTEIEKYRFNLDTGDGREFEPSKTTTGEFCENYAIQAKYESYSYVKLQNEWDGLEFMLNGDRIVRIDLASPTNGISQITTQSGAKIGDTEAQILALYPGQVEVSEHKYVSGGHDLTVTPQPNLPNDRNYRWVFETDGDRVTSIRAGQLPEVEWVERCS